MGGSGRTVIDGLGIHFLHVRSPDTISTSTVARRFAEMPPNKALEINRHDVLFDGDFVVFYALGFVGAGGERVRAEVTVDKGGPAGAWVALGTSPAWGEGSSAARGDDTGGPRVGRAARPRRHWNRHATVPRHP